MKIGGWHSVGPEALKTCQRCGASGLAWAKNKAGRPYLCYTRRVNTDYREAYWIMPNAPHSCEEYTQRKAAVEAQTKAAQGAAAALREDVVALSQALSAAPPEKRAGILKEWTERQARVEEEVGRGHRG